MDRHLTGANKTRRLASIALGSLAIIALAASPAMAHAKIGTADTSRHNLLASELVGADDTEAADLESLLDSENANDQGPNVDEVDGPDDQSGQVDSSNDGPDEVDGANNEVESVDAVDDSTTGDSTTGDSGSSDSGSADSGSHDGGGDSGNDGGGND